jgi:hypothetical protein
MKSHGFTKIDFMILNQKQGLFWGRGICGYTPHARLSIFQMAYTHRSKGVRSPSFLWEEGRIPTFIFVINTPLVEAKKDYGGTVRSSRHLV